MRYFGTNINDRGRSKHLQCDLDLRGSGLKRLPQRLHARFWALADISICGAHVRLSRHHALHCKSLLLTADVRRHFSNASLIRYDALWERARRRDPIGLVSWLCGPGFGPKRIKSRGRLSG